MKFRSYVRFFLSLSKLKLWRRGQSHQGAMGPSQKILRTECAITVLWVQTKDSEWRKELGV